MWLISGAILIALSLAIGYHQDQRLAHAALAAIDEDPAVAVQDVSGTDDANTSVIGKGGNSLDVAGAHSPKLSRMRGNIALFGFFLVLGGGLLALKQYIPVSRRQVRSDLASSDEFLSVSTPQFFEPIASQDELQNEDAADQASVIVSRVLSRTAEAFETTTTRVKSRL